MGMNQHAIHHLDYQENIDDLLDGALDKLDKEEQVGYIKKYGTYIKCAIYDVQLCASMPNIRIRGTEVMTEAIAVYACQSHTKLSMNLMEYMAPATLDSIKNDIKFIPAHMPYDKSITNEVCVIIPYTIRQV
eukprot:380941-Ditylum_brightwellii.AAC.1